MVAMIKAMRDDKVFACGEEIRNSKKAPLVEPRMFIGAAANPFGDPFLYRVSRLAKKAKAGADFVQTQCVYDMERFRNWMERVCSRGIHEHIHIMAGVTPLKSVRMAEYMRDHVAGLTVPETLIERLRNAENPVEEGQRIAVEQIQELSQMPGIHGVHIMAIEGEHTVADLVKQAGLLPRPMIALPTDNVSLPEIEKLRNSVDAITESRERVPQAVG